MALETTLGVLGFGNMGQAIVRGLVDTGTLAASSIRVFDVDSEKVAQAKELGAVEAASPAELASDSGVLLIAVKPQSIDEALAPVAGALGQDALAISIMAGVSIDCLREKLGGARKIVRVMPNLPALVGAGAAALAFSSDCTEADQATARAVFEAVGVAEFVEESAMDAITALSGSGPAYYFYVTECLTKAGAALGLPADQAGRLAAQTLLGAALLVRDSSESAAVLRERVTSKGGTTEAALKSFRENGLEDILATGMKAAAARSSELGR